MTLLVNNSHTHKQSTFVDWFVSGLSQVSRTQKVLPVRSRQQQQQNIKNIRSLSVAIMMSKSLKMNYNLN
jgi:hypothetical protein